MQQRILCYVTDGEPLRGEAAVLAAIRKAVTASIDWIQVREKTLPASKLLSLVRAAVDAAQGKTRILVNDRLDVAIAAGAGGVHLGSASLPVADVTAWLSRESQRLRLSPDFLVGRSCHSLAEAQQAERDGAGYLVFGPVFATPSKAQFGPPLGVDRLADVCRAVRIPVLAIGGIAVQNAADCFRAGATGIAAIRLFQEASVISETVQQLRKKD